MKAAQLSEPLLGFVQQSCISDNPTSVVVMSHGCPKVGGRLTKPHSSNVTASYVGKSFGRWFLIQRVFQCSLSMFPFKCSRIMITWSGFFSSFHVVLFELQKDWGRCNVESIKEEENCSNLVHNVQRPWPSQINETGAYLWKHLKLVTSPLVSKSCRIPEWLHML
jgi:hypothetical protein